MKMFAMAALVLASVSGQFAQAKSVTLEGARAEAFIARHFPDADIPGPVSGRFEYITKTGQQLKGYADCFVPAMGGRSNGQTSSCDVIY